MAPVPFLCLFIFKSFPTQLGKGDSTRFSVHKGPSVFLFIFSSLNHFPYSSGYDIALDFLTENGPVLFFSFFSPNSSDKHIALVFLTKKASTHTHTNRRHTPQHKLTQQAALPLVTSQRA